MTFVTENSCDSFFLRCYISLFLYIIYYILISYIVYIGVFVSHFLIVTTVTVTHKALIDCPISSLQGPESLGASCFDKGAHLLDLLHQQRLNHRLAQAFGQMQLHNDVVLRLLHHAVAGAEDGLVAAAAPHGVGPEHRRPVVLGHHAALLAHKVPVGHNVVVLLKFPRRNLYLAVFKIHRLRFDACVVDKDNS